MKRTFPIDRRINKTNVYLEIIILVLFFLVNPFFTLCIAIYKLFDCRKEQQKIVYFFFISLFFGLLAYTQNTRFGDISRVYNHILTEIRNPSATLEGFLINNTYPVFDIINILLAKLTNNVQVVSLFWGWVVYFFYLLGLNNILCKYCGVKNTHYMGMAVVISTFCLIIFSEATELFKQAITTSLFFYSYSCSLLNKKYKAVIVLIISLGIHLSVLFYIPLFFAEFAGVKKLFLLYLISFSFWTIDFMDIVASLTNGIPYLALVSERAQFYSGNLEGFYSSTALTFQIIYWLIVLLSCVILFVGKSRTILFPNVCFMFLIILNLCYGNNHNFTRLLALSYPIFALLLIDYIHSKFETKMFFVYILALVTLIVNVKYTHDRLYTKGYNTSYMNNSIIRIVMSPVVDYIDENEMSNKYRVN